MADKTEDRQNVTDVSKKAKPRDKRDWGRQDQAINEAIRQSGAGRPDWLRKALLSAAGSDKSAS